MKIKINKDVIKDLRPCKDRYENYLKHYSDFDGDILEFLNLENITPQDKVWVSVRVMPRSLVEIFAIDCASYAAAAYAAAAYAAAYADADAAADAAYAAAFAAADAAFERERQLDAIAYLVKTHKEN